ncbi:MAG: expansin EXLX1 family cellulose-binding protein [Reinekea sp.]
MRLSTVVTLLFASTVALNATAKTGEGTYYQYDGGGNCSFPIQSDIPTAAMNAKDYNNSAACGAVISVTNTDTRLSVTVRIDDQCPECAEGDVDLTPAAFEQIAALSTGRIPISWQYIANPVAGNIKLFFKEGSSQYWTAVQLRNHRYPVADLAFRRTSSGDAYQSLKRQSYNYFLKEDGFGTGPYDFRLTDYCGQTVDIRSVPFSVTTEIDAGLQLPVYTGTNCDIAANIGNDDMSGSSSADSSSNGGAFSMPVLLLLLIFRRHRCMFLELSWQRPK